MVNLYICDHAGECDISSEQVWCNTPFDINRLPENNHFNQPCSHCGCEIVRAIPYKEEKKMSEYKPKQKIQEGDTVKIFASSHSVYADTLKMTGKLEGEYKVLILSKLLPSYYGEYNDTIIQQGSGRKIFIKKEYLKKVSK